MKSVKSFFAAVIIGIFTVTVADAVEVNEQNITGVWLKNKGKARYYYIIKNNGTSINISKEYNGDRWFYVDLPDLSWKLKGRVFYQGNDGSMHKEFRIVRLTGEIMTARGVRSSDSRGSYWGAAEIYTKMDALDTWAQPIMDNIESYHRDVKASQGRAPIVSKASLHALYGEEGRPDYAKLYFKFDSDGRGLVTRPGVNNAARMYNYTPNMIRWKMQGNYVYTGIPGRNWYIFFKIVGAGDSTIRVQMRNINYTSAGEMWSQPKTFRRMNKVNDVIKGTIYNYDRKNPPFNRF